MDAISYSYADKAQKRIKKFIENPDSTSGVLTVPKTIAAGETITIPAGRVAILPDLQVDGDLVVDGDLFIPTGSMTSQVVQKVTSTDNAVVRFNGVTGDVQNSGVIIDDNNNITQNGASSSQFSLNVGGSLKGWIYSGTSGTALASADYLTFNTNNTEKMRIDASGNIGIGVTPSAWLSTTKGIEIGNYASIVGTINGTQIYSNAYRGASNYIYKNGTYATLYEQSSGSHQWFAAPSGTAGNAITWNTAMILDANGNLGIGVAPSAWTSNRKVIDLGTVYGGVSGGSATEITANAYSNGTSWIYKNTYGAARYLQDNGVHQFQSVSSGTAGTAMTLDTCVQMSTSGFFTYRSSFYSVPAANTSDETYLIANINPLGASVGLLVYNGALGGNGNAAASIVKVGKTSNGRSINAAGTINTGGNDYAEYEYNNGIKITKGQIVGFKSDGTLTDKFSESIRFGIKSTNPSYVGGDTWGSEEIVGARPERPEKTEEITDEEFLLLEEKYKAESKEFNDKLEAERQKVDRIAYCGKVPVNVYNATPGQYIVAIDKDGGIDGIAVNKADMTFAQYQDAVGRVNKILDDGRAEVAVIIH